MRRQWAATNQFGIVVWDLWKRLAGLWRHEWRRERSLHGRERAGSGVAKSTGDCAAGRPGPRQSVEPVRIGVPRQPRPAARRVESRTAFSGRSQRYCRMFGSGIGDGGSAGHGARLRQGVEIGGYSRTRARMCRFKSNSGRSGRSAASTSASVPDTVQAPPSQSIKLYSTIRNCWLALWSHVCLVCVAARIDWSAPFGLAASVVCRPALAGRELRFSRAQPGRRVRTPAHEPRSGRRRRSSSGGGAPRATGCRARPPSARGRSPESGPVRCRLRSPA